MRVQQLQCTGVKHEHDFNIMFHPDLTFLTGVNGSGKTTALRMLTALITPRLGTICTTQFRRISATLSDDRRVVVISAERDADAVALRVDTIDEALILPGRWRGAESPDDLVSEHAEHPVIRSILGLTSPMFIGLDRRWATPRERYARAHHKRFRRRDAEAHFSRVSAKLREASDRRPGPLTDVEILVEYAKREVLRRQARLDAGLRNDLMLSALAPFEMPHFSGAIRPPNTEQIVQLRAKKDALAQTAANLGLGSGEGSELANRLDAYLDRIEGTLRSIERLAANRRPSGARAPGAAVSKEEALSASMDWLFSMTYMDRVVSIFERVDRYLQQRKEMNAPFVRLETCVNAFYSQTGRRVSIDDDARIFVHAHERQHLVKDLSSGERQILVLAAHLALDPDLQDGGVFIVDEPEVSLHIAWQQCFVEQMMRVAPSVQFIMATHSPAIIMNREKRCVDLSRGVMADA